MASNYPTSLDTFTNPTATSLLTSPSHSALHSDINDAVEALETKVGIGNTILGNYTAYTPTYSNFTLGNGTVTAKYCQVNDFVHVIGSIVLGSTSAITGTLGISMFFSVDAVYLVAPVWTVEIGTASLFDVSATGIYNGTVQADTGTVMRIFAQASSGPTVTRSSVNATAPFTWATGDIITWNVYFKKA